MKRHRNEIDYWKMDNSIGNRRASQSKLERREENSTALPPCLPVAPIDFRRYTPTTCTHRRYLSATDVQFSFCFDYQWDRLLFYAAIFLLVATASFAYSTSSPLPCSSFCSFCTDHLLLLAQKHAHTHIHTHTYTHSHTHLLMPQENPSRILAPMIISQRSIRNHLSQQQSWKGLHSKYFRGWCTTIKKQNPLESQTSSSKKLFETRIKRISNESYKKKCSVKKNCSELSSHKNRETNPNAAEKWCWENPWTIGEKIFTKNFESTMRKSQ